MDMLSALMPDGSGVYGVDFDSILSLWNTFYSLLQKDWSGDRHHVRQNITNLVCNTSRTTVDIEAEVSLVDGMMYLFITLNGSCV